MIADKDIQKMMDRFSEVFTTKVELNYEIQRLEEKIDNLPTRDEYRHFMVVVEKVLVQVNKMSEEQSAHFNEHRTTNNRLDRIEAVPVIALALSK